MNIETLYNAVDLVQSSQFRSNARELTFLRTYPALLTAAHLPAQDASDAFLRTASLAYAWMPQPLRLDNAHLTSAIDAFTKARAPDTVACEQVIDPIAACLSSLEGAAKVLHLANPERFPIWDERIERFRLQEQPTPYHMGQSRSYMSFIEDIQSVIAHPLFLTFHHAYCTAHQARLQRLMIPPYPLTETRVVESAATELVGN